MTPILSLILGACIGLVAGAVSGWFARGMWDHVIDRSPYDGDFF